jgi:hypothetical protein
MKKSMRIYRLAIFEYGQHEAGSSWFSILPLHWGTDLIFEEKGALIEVAWVNGRLLYVEFLWDLSQALRLARYYFKYGEPISKAIPHGFRNIYHGRVD